jgi:hypothetical protein
MAKYNIYHGEFKCQECGVLVTSLRLYAETKELTWMCPDKHMSNVSLKTKKTKKDYEREERE